MSDEDTEPQGFVYCVTNTINNKYYIGSHCGSNPNYRGSGVLLKAAYAKYGYDAFVFEVLFYCDDYQEQEGLLLRALGATQDPQMYNLVDDGCGGSRGRVIKDSTREKLRLAKLGTKNPEHSKRMTGEGHPNYGKVTPTATRAKISRTLRNQPKKKCRHCTVMADPSNLARWHNDNCKHKPKN